MVRDMTRGRPLSLIWRYALPLMLSALFQECYTVFDSLIVGRLLGADAFAAIGSASRLNIFPLNMLLGLSIGFGVPLAQCFGAKDNEGYRRHFACGIGLMLLFGSILTLLGGCFLNSLLNALKTPVELTGHAFRYLRVLWSGLLISAMLNMFSSALYTVGDSHTPFVALMASTFINIALDFVFILLMKMDVEGAALATVLSQTAAAGWCMRRIWRIREIVPERRHFRWNRPVLFTMLRLGIPQMLCHSVTGIGEMTVQAAINLQGKGFVQGMVASRKYFSLLNVVGNGLEGALATFVGQNAGANETLRIQKGVRDTLMIGIMAALVLGGATFAFAEPMIRFFLPDAAQDVIRTGTVALRVEAVFLVFLYLLCEVRAAIQGMGNALIPMISGFMELGFRIATVFALVHFSGREGLYYTDGAAWAPTAVMLMACYLFMIRRRQSMRLRKEKST